MSSKSDYFLLRYGFLTIFKMAALRHLGFSNLQFLSCSLYVGMPFCFLVQNFAEIGQSINDLWPKKAIFKMAAVRHVQF